MSIVIPAIATSTVTIAQLIYQWKQYKTIGSRTPVAGDWYTILDETGGVELRNVTLMSDDDEEATKDCEVRVTMDAVVFASGTILNSWQTINPISLMVYGVGDVVTYAPVGGETNTAWIPHFGINNAGTGHTSDIAGPYLSAHAIKVEIRQTEAVGTNPKINWGLIYAKWEAVA